MEFEKLQEIIADVLNVDPNEVTMETTFADDLGADSLDVFQIVMGNGEGAVCYRTAPLLPSAEHLQTVTMRKDRLKTGYE